MSLKIKIFSSTQNNISSLENEVNSWIAVNSDFDVKDIKVTFSEHSILMTIIYKSSGRALQTSAPREVSPTFQETLSAFSSSPEPRITMNNTKNTNNIAAAVDSINPSQVKPGKLIQNNYSKYSKSNQVVSEDQAFNWD